MADAKDGAMLAAIGLICIQWSNIEFSLSNIIWQLLDLDGDTGKFVTGGLDMLPKLNMAINLARHKKAPRRLTSALVSARKTIQDGLDVRRNRAVHGYQFMEDDGGFSIEMHRGKGARIRTLGDHTEFYSLTKELQVLRESMALECVELILAMTEKIRAAASDKVSTSES